MCHLGNQIIEYRVREDYGLLVCYLVIKLLSTSETLFLQYTDIFVLRYRKIGYILLSLTYNINSIISQSFGWPSVFTTA